MARRWQRLALVLTVVASASLSAGCSVRPQSHPVVLPSQPGVARADRPGDGTPTPAPVTVFWLTGGRLVAAAKRVPGGGLGAAMTALATGPSPAERRAGLRSALPPGLSHLDVSVSRGVVTVTVPPGFDQLGPDRQVAAMAQLVYTAMAQPGLVGVALADDTGPVDIPVDGGRLVPGPVTRSDYRDVAPR